MADEPESERAGVTKEELDAFAAKLQGWAKDLSDREQALLSGILASAGPPPDMPEDDVVGFTMPVPMPRGPGPLLPGPELPIPWAQSWGRLWAQTIPR